jgi:uncharacterized membrane protein
MDPYAIFLVRWLHIVSGIMWIGLLWYFNFVQIPNMGKIPDEQKPAISKVIAPAALFWFRWAALATIVFGLIQAWQLGWIGQALSLGLGGSGAKMMMIGFGMWFGLIMAFNVWFVIWPNQQRALGLVDCPADQKPKSARTAMLFSRTNTMLSIPMSYSMVAGPHLF